MAETSSSHRIEHLTEGDDKWQPWKKRLIAVLEDRELEEFLEEESYRDKPTMADPDNPTADEKKDIRAWERREAKTRSQITLSLAADQMIYIEGCETAWEMWKSLCDAKEPKGFLGVMTARRQLYRTNAEEGTDIEEHIQQFRRVVAQLNAIGSPVHNQEFIILLATSMPESWDQFIGSYLAANNIILQGQKTVTEETTIVTTPNTAATAPVQPSTSVSTTSTASAAPTAQTQTKTTKTITTKEGPTIGITPNEFVALILEENCRRKRTGTSGNKVFFNRSNKDGKKGTHHKGKGNSQRNNNKEGLHCTNCGKKDSHTTAQCWSKSKSLKGNQSAEQNNAQP
jgi:hypothetical protein